MPYTTDDLRIKWLDFYREKSHAIIPSARVVPENDPTALFINSGMHPLVPYLMGEAHPQGVRLANVQKCVRTGDIEEVGDATHLTFFEMLGNWSLGDYFKEEQIPWSFEFLTSEKWLGLPLERLAFSVFSGDADAPQDEFSFEAWKKCGVDPERIAFLGKEDNWWAKGEVGPCGPDTEMFYWTGEDPAPANFQQTHDDPRWVEIWNDVFMQFNKKDDGTLEPLPAQNIDTGMGLERTVAVLNGLTSVYETDAFADILRAIADLSGHPEIADNPVGKSDVHHSARVIADHLRTSCVMIADGVVPGNVDQGYILRRILRRAIRHGRTIGVTQNITTPIAQAVIAKLGTHYPELSRGKDKVLEELEREETQFRATLESGERMFHKYAEKCSGGMIDGTAAFDLYQTYGFPLEMTQELAHEKGLGVDSEGFKAAYTQHQTKSRTASEGKFKGGLAGQSEQEALLHTATHLLHAGLKKVLGDHVEQKGSNITAERLRFDFSHPDKMTPEQIAEVEQYVNDAIAADACIGYEEMTVDEAKEKGAIGLFEHKYGDKIKVYSMGDYSMEICGGPHASNTGQLGSFKIQKEESSSRGVRRIKAVIGA